MTKISGYFPVTGEVPRLFAPLAENQRHARKILMRKVFDCLDLQSRIARVEFCRGLKTLAARYRSMKIIKDTVPNKPELDRRLKKFVKHASAITELLAPAAQAVKRTSPAKGETGHRRKVEIVEVSTAKSQDQALREALLSIVCAGQWGILEAQLLSGTYSAEAALRQPSKRGREADPLGYFISDLDKLCEKITGNRLGFNFDGLTESRTGNGVMAVRAVALLLGFSIDGSEVALWGKGRRARPMRNADEER